MYHGAMTKPLELQLDRTTNTPLADQICIGITKAIESGVLAAGARLPSWVDLAVQLGVARGTVRSAYDKLSAAQLIVASRAAGTRVTERPILSVPPDPAPEAGSFMETYLEMISGPAIFQMGAARRRRLFLPRFSPGFAPMPCAPKQVRHRCIRIHVEN